MAKKVVQKPDGTQTVKRKMNHMEEEGEMLALTIKKTDKGYQINDLSMTTWAMEIKKHKQGKNLTNDILSVACGLPVKGDTIKKSWTKKIPSSRSKTINLAYALRLSREEADILISKHAGYTRFQAMYDEDVVDMYLFDHRDTSKPVEPDEYNRLHALYLEKLNRADPADEDFLTYCNRVRNYATDHKQETIDFLNQYAPPAPGETYGFLKYLMDEKVADSIRAACNNRNIRFKRDELILLGLKLCMPWQLIDELLKKSGHHELYARNFMECWLLYALYDLFVTCPSYFGIGNDASLEMICEVEPYYGTMSEIEMGSTHGMSLYEAIYNQILKRVENINELEEWPDWFDPKYQAEYHEPDRTAIEGKEEVLAYISKYMQRSKEEQEEENPVSKIKGEKYPFLNYLAHPETARRLKRACLSKKEYLERDELILIALKLRMPRSMLNYLLEISGNRELDADCFPENLLAGHLERIFKDQPGCFGMGNDSSESMIRDFEPDFCPAGKKAPRASLYRMIHDEIMQYTGELKALDELPIWLREEYLPEYAPSNEKVYEISEEE